MTPEEIARTLDEIEGSLERGETPDRRRFWRVVGVVKRDPALVERFADRIGELDRALFERWVRFLLPPAVGEGLLWAGFLVGLVLVGAAYRLDPPLDGFALLAGFGALEATTHGLAHAVVARAQGMRIVGWFLGGPTKVQPGMKVDYATYLRVPPRRRAWMHAAGAIATKLTPFVVLGAAIAAGVAGWVQAIVLAVGIVQIVTDIVFWRKGDWAKVRRELRIAEELDRVGRGG